MTRILLLIGTGGFIGSVGRYLISQLIQNKFLSAFPYGTMIVNVLGCFMIGVVFSLSEKGSLPAEWRLFLATGICGGFTTFSAFTNESVALLRDGQLLYSFIYVGGSVIAGLISTYCGIALVKLV